ncbi:unnamed protein product [Rotaria sordida]|uniref:Uncharacterized protein n=1 Tax=Rotaria sordida TaxID=392033 RepID=A0A815NQF2_9BILA|nr:unnamed protein product [Rotaria sordida]CAF1441231.1 unnamed protein product [Rotaria sordida]
MFANSMRSTLTYIILFQDCFQTLPIRQMTVEHLVILWDQWDEHGLYSDQINRWINLAPEIKQLSRDIWNLVGQTVQRDFPIETLINEQYQEMQEKRLIQTKILTCLDTYCDDAVDKQFYLDLLLAMQQKFDHDTVRLVEVPCEIMTLLPSVDRLTPLSTSRSWLIVLSESQESSTREFIKY